MNITVAISGGTDSLFALLSLREAGHSVTALHARFLPAPESGDPVPAMRELCSSLGVPLVVADLTQDFLASVVEPFALEHTLARTPNPCALCNRAMKFGRLLDIALEHGEAFATGHYAALAGHPVYGPALKAGSDSVKDQSYFLALVPLERLRRTLFPLAEWKKDDIRAWLRARGFEPPIPAESQEICFIPHDDHYAWLEQRRAEGLALPGPGPVILAGAEPLPEKPKKERRGRKGSASAPPLPACSVPGRLIAEHRGLWQYTEGQRRGLRIPWSEPIYVLRRELASNTLVVGPKHLLPVDSCSARALNLMVPPALWPDRLFVRVRYHQSPIPADVHIKEGGNGPCMDIRFHSPQQPPAPGQTAAVYDAEGFVLAGGILD